MGDVKRPPHIQYDEDLREHQEPVFAVSEWQEWQEWNDWDGWEPDVSGVDPSFTGCGSCSETAPAPDSEPAPSTPR